MAGTHQVESEFESLKGVGRTVIADLRRGGFRRSVRRDLGDLYNFYVDDERRARLERMWAPRRWILLAWWLLKSLILRLSAVRRILLLISLLLIVQGRIIFSSGESSLRLTLAPLGYLILLVVLMLELKDKLLARDELEVGRTVQLALLPRDNPKLAGWDIWMYTRPANDVGGDLVDYLRVGDGRLGLALGDVAGKGLGAALLMARLQATLRAFATEPGSLAELGRRMNVILCRDSVSDRFATLVYLEAAPESGTVRVMNAGHLSPVVVRAGRADGLPPVALPLGVVPEAGFVEQTAEVGPGELLVVCSDGVTEAQNSAGDFYGDERLMALLPTLAAGTAETAGRRLLGEVERFVGEARTADDLSLIVMRRTAG